MADQRVGDGGVERLRLERQLMGIADAKVGRPGQRLGGGETPRRGDERRALVDAHDPPASAAPAGEGARDDPGAAADLEDARVVREVELRRVVLEQAREHAVPAAALEPFHQALDHVRAERVHEAVRVARRGHGQRR